MDLERFEAVFSHPMKYTSGFDLCFGILSARQQTGRWQQTGPPAAGGQMLDHQLLQAVMTQMTSLENRVRELHVQRAQDMAILTQQMTQQSEMINAEIRRIHRQSDDQLLAADGEANAEHIRQQLAQPVVAASAVVANNNNNNNATLSPTPRSLLDLWNEWTTGIGGRKAAKNFTAQERGKCKYKYTRRKRAWDIMCALIHSGHTTASTAVDRIYAEYGRGSTVTYILNRIATDRRNNTLHPDFCLCSN
jgi:hypothetical protein